MIIYEQKTFNRFIKYLLFLGLPSASARSENEQSSGDRNTQIIASVAVVAAFIALALIGAAAVKVYLRYKRMQSAVFISDEHTLYERPGTPL